MQLKFLSFLLRVLCPHLRVLRNGLSEWYGPQAACRVGGIVKTFALRSSTQKAGIWMVLLIGRRSAVPQVPLFWSATPLPPLRCKSNKEREKTQIQSELEATTFYRS